MTLLLEVEILVPPLHVVERQSEEGVLVSLLDVVDRLLEEGGFLTPMVMLARHRWYSGGPQASFGMRGSFFLLASGAGDDRLCFQARFKFSQSAK